MSKNYTQTALNLMDLTTLNESDTDAIVEALCKQVDTPFGSPAAVCIYPQFIGTAKKALADLGKSNVKVATVTNFPAGGDDVSKAAEETKLAAAAGADEVDVVFPYRALMAGNEQVGHELVSACKTACGDTAKLKVIIESGELKTPELIRKASEIAINAGADFIKTSTGKVPVNATLESAEIMLQAIADTNPKCGFKAAGGVRNADQAAEYLQLAERILGDNWVSPDHFRFGASSLLTSLLTTLESGKTVDSSGY